jgi:hypothetical protein
MACNRNWTPERPADKQIDPDTARLALELKYEQDNERFEFGKHFKVENARDLINNFLKSSFVIHKLRSK